jgi:hypothetical protein
MRIAATCLSVKQAVGYAADPGRAVERGGSMVLAPAFSIQASGSKFPSEPACPRIFAVSRQDKKRHIQEKHGPGMSRFRWMPLGRLS